MKIRPVDVRAFEELPHGGVVHRHVMRVATDTVAVVDEQGECPREIIIIDVFDPVVAISIFYLRPTLRIPKRCFVRALRHKKLEIERDWLQQQ